MTVANRQIATIEFGSNPMTVLVGDDGETWWLGREVCEVLGYTNPSAAIAKHVDPEDRDGITVRDSIGRDQMATTISESGLYSLILRSRKPEAKRFKRWVTHEVLPSIRRTGRFDVSGDRRVLAVEDLIAASSAAGATDEAMQRLHHIRTALLLGDQVPSLPVLVEPVTTAAARAQRFGRQRRPNANQAPVRTAADLYAALSTRGVAQFSVRSAQRVLARLSPPAAELRAMLDRGLQDGLFVILRDRSALRSNSPEYGLGEAALPLH